MSNREPENFKISEAQKQNSGTNITNSKTESDKLSILEQRMKEIRDQVSKSVTEDSKIEKNISPYSLIKRLDRLEEQLPLMKSSLDCIVEAQKQCFLITKRILLNHKLLERITNTEVALDTKEKEQLLQEMEENFAERLQNLHQAKK